MPKWYVLLGQVRHCYWLRSELSEYVQRLIKRWWHLFPVSLIMVGVAMKNAWHMKGFYVTLFSMRWLLADALVALLFRTRRRESIGMKSRVFICHSPADRNQLGLVFHLPVFCPLLLTASLWIHLCYFSCWKILLPANIKLLSIVCQVQFLQLSTSLKAIHSLDINTMLAIAMIY